MPPSPANGSHAAPAIGESRRCQLRVLSFLATRRVVVPVPGQEPRDVRPLPVVVHHAGGGVVRPAVGWEPVRRLWTVDLTGLAVGEVVRVGVDPDADADRPEGWRWFRLEPQTLRQDLWLVLHEVAPRVGQVLAALLSLPSPVPRLHRRRSGR